MDRAIRTIGTASTRNARPASPRPRAATIARGLLWLRALAAGRSRAAAFAEASDAEAAALAAWTAGRELDAAKWNAVAPIYAGMPRRR